MKAAFFGGAMTNRTSKEYLDSIEIGKILKENNYIVKNGGLMEAVSLGHGELEGYVCNTFKSIKGNEYLKKIIVCNDIYDRLRFLIEDTQLYVVQKGSVGTLAELFLTLDVLRKVENAPKVILIGEFWNNINYALSEIVSGGLNVTIVNNLVEFRKVLSINS